MRTELELQNVCKSLNVTNFKIKRGKVFIFQDIDLSNQKLKEFPFGSGELKYMKGCLLLRDNKLKDCIGFPERIDGVLDISGNPLKTLDGISYKAKQLNAFRTTVSLKKSALRFVGRILV